MFTEMPVLTQPSGGGGKIYDHLFQSADLASPVTFDTGISTPKMLILYTIPTGYTTPYVWKYDIENGTAIQTYDSSHFEDVNTYIPTYFSISGSQITYTPPSANWQNKTRIVVF